MTTSKQALNLILPLVAAPQSCPVDELLAGADSLIKLGDFPSAQHKVESALTCATGLDSLPLLNKQYEVLRNQREFRSALAAARDACMCLALSGEVKAV